MAKTAGARTNEAGAIAHVAMWDHWKARDRLVDIQSPTLLICGDADRSTHPDLSIEMWRKIPRSHLFIAPNAGHAVHLEYPDVFNAVVKRFLEPCSDQEAHA